MSDTSIRVEVPPTAPVDPSLEAHNKEVPPAEPKKEEAPKLFADRFKSVEELENGYKNLLKMSSSEKKTNVDIKIPEPPKEEDKLDFDKYAEEFNANGKLSEETYKHLEKKGIPKEVVDVYTEGISIKKENEVKKIMSIVGTEEEFNNMLNWASKNIAPEEQQLFNSLVTNPDANVVKLAVMDLSAKYKNNISKPPSKQAEGKPSSGPSGETYESHAQFMADLKKPEYEKDEKFRLKVQEKLSRSKF